MTAIAACKVGNKVVIGCDSQITTGGTKERGICKLVEFPYFTVGIAGGLTILHVLQEMAKDTKFVKGILMKTEEDARNFAKAVYSLLRDDYEFNNNEASLNDSGMLIATKEKIFDISPWMSVIAYDDYTAIGSGGTIAKAIMRTLRDQVGETDPSKIVSLAIDNAAHSDLYCSLPSYVFECRNEQPIPKPKRPSSSKPKGRKKSKSKGGSGKDQSSSSRRQKRHIY